MAVRPARKSATSGDESSRSVYKDAERQVRSEGMTLPVRPESEETIPLVPADVTELDDKSLMKLMVELVAWMEYVGVRLARGEIEERELDLQIVKRQSTLIVESWGGTSKDRVRVVRAEAETDGELEKLRMKHLTAQAYRKIVENLYTTCERRVNLVSRELTRRTSTEPFRNRVHKHGGA
jgi:hypothetical protein